MKKILRGQQRELTARFIAFRSHWQYQAEFCTPSEGHEKGGVEGEVGYFRRNHWVPVPVAAGLAALNRKLLEDCRADESRIVSGQTECVGARLLTEKEHLLPLATERLRSGRDQLPARRPDGVREGADELLLRAIEAGLDRRGTSLFHHGRVPSPWQPDRQPRALLQPIAEDLRSGALSRRARPQARRVARFDAAGAVEGAGPVA